MWSTISVPGWRFGTVLLHIARKSWPNNELRCVYTFSESPYGLA